ncbi:MAG: XRE family transcriptional regulator [Lachnospiraceae bacterium]|nr:XRE family transcriptional regulator [Lachnospiraceae bacterium]
MGKQSTRENKNIYQRCREEQGLTREKASEKMIGDRYVPEIEMSELSNIILETIASLNEITPLTNRLIQITRDGMISDDEIKDFAFISKKPDEVSLAIDSLNLWIDKTASENNINIELLNTEKEKLK